LRRTTKLGMPKNGRKGEPWKNEKERDIGGGLGQGMPGYELKKKDARETRRDLMEGWKQRTGTSKGDLLENDSYPKARRTVAGKSYRLSIEKR